METGELRHPTRTPLQLQRGRERGPTGPPMTAAWLTCFSPTPPSPGSRGGHVGPILLQGQQSSQLLGTLCLTTWTLKDKPEPSPSRAGLQKALLKGAKYLRWLREWPGLSLLN